jgi:bacteriorhodopsin
MDEIMIITGLVGALVASSYKWGYFVFAMFALFFIAYNVVLVGRAHASAINSTVSKTYLICGVWTIFLWFIYPIAWGLSEGGNVISPDSEAVFYGILDILAKPVFGALLLFGHRNIDPAVLGLNIRDYTTAPSHGHEKGAYSDNTNTGGVLGNGAHHTTGNTTDNTIPATTGTHPTTSAV